MISEHQISEVAVASMRVGGVGEMLREADQQTHDSALAAIEQALRERIADGEVRVTRGVLLVTGTA